MDQEHFCFKSVTQNLISRPAGIERSVDYVSFMSRVKSKIDGWNYCCTK